MTDTETKTDLALHCGYHHTVLVPGGGGDLVGWGTGPNGELSTEEGFSEFDAGRLKLPHTWRSKGTDGTQAGVGAKHTVVLTDGNVYTMGSNENGRLGHDRKQRYGKVEFPYKDEYIQHIAVGASFNVAVGKDFKRLYSWGLGLYGNLGIGRTPLEERYPVMFRIDDGYGAYKSVKQVSCGSEYALALCFDGSVYSWGSGKGGRLGHGNTMSISTPKIIKSLVVSHEDRVIEIAAGEFHALALDAQGDVYSWGSGSFGRLGLGTEHNQYTPKVIPGLKKIFVVGISCHVYHSLAVVKGSGRSHTLYTWGGGQYGKLGNREDKNCMVPRPVRYFGLRVRDEPVILAGCGFDFTVAITKSGRIYAWGYTSNKRCGGLEHRRRKEILEDSEPTFVSEPMLVNDGIQGLDAKFIVGFQFVEKKATVAEQELKVRQIETGVKHTVARLGGNNADGYIMAWGSNRMGQIGTGEHEIANTPLKVRLEKGPIRLTVQTAILEVACGDFHTLACTASGSIYAWGNNSYGQLGLGDTVMRNRPFLLELLQGTVVEGVAAGGSHSMAIPVQPKRGQQRFPHVFVWGDGSRGQLGLGRSVTGAKTPQLLELKIPPIYQPSSTKQDGGGGNGTGAGQQIEEDLGEQEEEVVKGLQVSLGKDHSLILTMHLKVTKAETETSTVSYRRRKNDLPPVYTQVFAFGSGKNGKLGLNDFDARYEPKKIERWEYNISENDKERMRQRRQRRKEQENKEIKVVKVVAGPTCSMAIVDKARTSDTTKHEIWGWGHVHGIWPNEINAPRCIFPEFVNFHTALRDSNTSFAGFTNTVKVMSLSVASKHTLATISLNRDAPKVVAFGSAKFGCLGIGNVVTFMSEDKKRNRETGGFTGGNEGNAGDRFYPPLHISCLRDSNITLVSCRGEHSIAASTLTGNIFAWGHCADGRLGLGESEGKLAETEPIAIPKFDPAVIENERKAHEEGVALVFDGDGDEEEAEENDHDEGLKVAEKQAKKVEQNRIKGFGRVGAGDASAALAERMREISKTKTLRSKISDQVLRYEELVKQYSEQLDKYTDRADLVRRSVLERIAQHHPLNPEEAFPLTQGVSHQPHTLTHLTTKRNPYDLNPLERVVARIHVSPSEFFHHIYENPPNAIRAADGRTTKTDLSQEEKNLFVKLALSVYDTFRESHFQRLLILLRLILSRHVETSKQWNSFLKSDTVEWMLFKGTMNSGPLKAKLRKALRPALISIKWLSEPGKEGKDESSKDGAGSSSNNAYTNFVKLAVEARTNPAKINAMKAPLSAIKEMAETFVSSLTTQFIEPLIESVKKVALVLFDVLEGSTRQVVIGELIVRAIAEIAIAEFSAIVRKSKHVTSRCIKLILHMIRGREQAIRYIARTYLLENYTKSSSEDRELAKRRARNLLGTFSWINIKRQMLDNKGEPFVRENYNADAIQAMHKTHFTRYLEYLKADRAKKSQFDDEDLQEAKERAERKETTGGVTEYYTEGRHNLLVDFLLERSTLNHTTLQIPIRAVHRFIVPLLDKLAEPCNGTAFWGEVLRHELGKVKGEMTTRQTLKADQKGGLWPFGKDKREMWRQLAKDPTIPSKGVLPPPLRNSPYRQTLPNQMVLLPGDVKHDEKSTKHRPAEKLMELTRRECVRLWFTLREPQCCKIVQEFEANKAWEGLETALGEMRQKALETKENAAVDQLEWCRRQIRRFHHKDRKTLVRLDVQEEKEAGYNHGGPEDGQFHDSLDPAELFRRLEAIDTASRLANEVLGQNLLVVKKVNDRMESRLKRLNNNSRELVNVFRRLSLNTRAEKKGDTIRGFLVTWKSTTDYSLARKYNAVEVTRKQGNLVVRSYQELKDSQIIIQKDSSDTMGFFPRCFGDESNWRLRTFRKNLVFKFLTTTRQNEIALRVMYLNKSKQFDLLIAAELVIPFEIDVIDIDRKQEAKAKASADEKNARTRKSRKKNRNRSGNKAEKAQICKVIIVRDGKEHTDGKLPYNPLGDRTPLREPVEIKFNLDSLRNFLDNDDIFCRPRRVFDEKQFLRSSRLEDLLQKV
ncbi:hypothetical protein AAMO2058_000678300 [Amorphochlora amoebiformis]